MTRAAATARTAVQLPEPGRFWVRYAPRAWPGPAGPWLDLAAGTLGETSGAVLDLGPGPFDDLVYLPPVRLELCDSRDALARELLAAGAPALVQLLPGEACAVEGATAVYDLLDLLLERDLGRLDALPAGAAAAWPLLPGLTDDPGLWAAGCERLAARGVRQVQALTPCLSPAERRRLAELGDEAAFEPLFHREPPSERDFARVAHRWGLEPFLPRPLPRPPVRGIGNRRLAGALALAAELWLRLGRPVGQGQAFYAAARGADRTPYDLGALAREGNLPVLGWLDPASRALVEEHAATGASALLAELLAEYLAGDDEKQGE